MLALMTQEQTKRDKLGVFKQREMTQTGNHTKDYQNELMSSKNQILANQGIKRINQTIVSAKWNQSADIYTGKVPRPLAAPRPKYPNLPYPKYLTLEMCEPTHFSLRFHRFYCEPLKKLL